MIVVPLKNDIVTARTGETGVVISYTGLKDEPAVYIDDGETINFDFITEINGVKVEYSDSNKVFTSLGPLKRKHQLPQPGEAITVDGSESVRPSGAHITSELKLHNKALGVTRGLIVSTDSADFELTEISDIEGVHFYKNSFLKYYADYLPMNYKVDKS